MSAEIDKIEEIDDLLVDVKPQIPEPTVFWILEDLPLPPPPQEFLSRPELCDPQMVGLAMWSVIHNQFLLGPRIGIEDAFVQTSRPVVLDRVAILPFESQWHESTIQQKVSRGIRLAGQKPSRKLKASDLTPKKSVKVDWRTSRNEHRRK
jgi:hypothetical protein